MWAWLHNLINRLRQSFVWQYKLCRRRRCRMIGEDHCIAIEWPYLITCLHTSAGNNGCRHEFGPTIAWESRTDIVLSCLSLAWSREDVFYHRSRLPVIFAFVALADQFSRVDVLCVFNVFQTGVLYWQCTRPVGPRPRLQSKPSVLLSELWRWLLGEVLGHKKCRRASESSVRPLSLVCNSVSELCLFTLHVFPFNGSYVPSSWLSILPLHY